jgi:hypothetical protein
MTGFGSGLYLILGAGALWPGVAFCVGCLIAAAVVSLPSA